MNNQYEESSVSEHSSQNESSRHDSTQSSIHANQFINSQASENYGGDCSTITLSSDDKSSDERADWSTLSIYSVGGTAYPNRSVSSYESFARSVSSYETFPRSSTHNDFNFDSSIYTNEASTTQEYNN